MPLPQVPHNLLSCAPFVKGSITYKWSKNTQLSHKNEKKVFGNTLLCVKKQSLSKALLSNMVYSRESKYW